MKELVFTLTPLFLWGPPGVAKTAMAMAIAKALYGVKYDEAMERYNVPDYARKIFDANRPAVENILADGCHTIICSADDPTDSGGVITINTGATVKTCPLYFLVACFIPIVIFLDEFTAAQNEQRGPATRLCDDTRMMNGFRLHEGTRVVAAANPPEFSVGAARELTAPELTRFRHMTIGHEHAVEWMLRHENQWVRLAGTYLQRNPTEAIANPERMRKAVAEQVPFPTPRSWTRCALEVWPNQMEDTDQYVGIDAASTFLNWFNKMDLPDQVEILAGTCTTVPDRGDAVMVTVTGMVGIIGEKPSLQTVKNAMRYFRLCADGGFVSECVPALKKMLGNALILSTVTNRCPEDLKPYMALLDHAKAA